LPPPFLWQIAVKSSTVSSKGITEGANSKARETAAKMLAKNKPIDEIAEFTGLPESEILAIKAEPAQ
jgi:hypothetical protein